MRSASTISFALRPTVEVLTETQTGFSSPLCVMASVHGRDREPELAAPAGWTAGAKPAFAHVVSVNYFFRRPKVPIVAVQGGTEQPRPGGAALP